VSRQGEYSFAEVFLIFLLFHFKNEFFRSFFPIPFKKLMGYDIAYSNIFASIGVQIFLITF